MKNKVLFFARSFLNKYYADMKSDIIEPVFVTMTKEEKSYLEKKGWKVYGCFEEDYPTIPVSDYAPNYLKTSFKSDRFLNRFEIDKRKEILGKEISFWGRILDENKPEMIVDETTAVEITEVLSIEAEKRNIPFYSSLLSLLPNTFYWKPRPLDGRLDDLSEVEVSENDIAVADQYLNDVREKQLRPIYVASTKKYNITLITVLHSLFLHLRVKRDTKRRERNQAFRYEDYSIFSALDVRRYWECLHHKYDSLSDIKGRKIIFYPMHVEPEGTLNYCVDENFEQTSIIQLIATAIKLDQYLVVKEHPQQQGMLLSKVFDDLRKRYKNIIYLPSYVSSFDVLRQCEAVVTLTSTAAWEGVILGKPAFVLGKIFFDQCPGVTRIDSLKQLKTELRKDTYPTPDIEKVRLFTAKIVAISHKGCPTQLYNNEYTTDLFIKAVEQLAIKL